MKIYLKDEYGKKVNILIECEIIYYNKIWAKENAKRYFSGKRNILDERSEVQEGTKTMKK